MIHVVTAENRHLYAATLVEMHRLRRIHFVEERGWAEMTVRDGGEYDRYDDELAVYLISLCPDGRVGCSMRMRPAEPGSVLTDIFPHLVAADEPSLNRPDVWEISRYFAAPHCRGRGGRRARAEIRLAALEVARARGANRLIGMIDLEMLPGTVSASGWNVRPLGLPAPYAEGVAQAIEVRVSKGGVMDLAETFSLKTSVCLEIDPRKAPDLPPLEIEALIMFSRVQSDQLWVIMALARRIIAVQDQADEKRLLEMVAQVQTLLRGEARGVH